MINRATKLRFRRRLRMRKLQVEEFGQQAEQQLERNFFRRLERLADDALHMVALAREAPCAVQLAGEWRNITGDSFIVDVRPIDQDDPASGFLEVFKYALKFSDMEPADTWAAFQVLRGRRLVGSAGLFRGIEIPEALTDEPLDDLPYVLMLYRYFAGGYAFTPLRNGRSQRSIAPATSGAWGSAPESRPQAAEASSI